MPLPRIDPRFLGRSDIESLWICTEKSFAQTRQWVILQLVYVWNRKNNSVFRNDALYVGGTLLVAQLVEALRYKPEVRGFDSRWCNWNFSLTQPLT
jgi:hypothetical protein